MAGNFWGSLVRDLRNEAGLSQRKLAEQANVNRKTLRSLENGTTPGEIDLIERLLDFFGYELEAFRSDSVLAKRMREEEMQLDPRERSKRSKSKLLSSVAL